MILHANCVAIDAFGVLIIGASGAGKSALSLQLMAFGAELVSDDRTHLHLINGLVHASVPAQIAGLIEARGIGILHAKPRSSAIVGVVIDLDQVEEDRLPEPYSHRLLGRDVPCLHKVEAPHFPAAILQYVREQART